MITTAMAMYLNTVHRTEYPYLFTIIFDFILCLALEGNHKTTITNEE